MDYWTTNKSNTEDSFSNGLIMLLPICWQSLCRNVASCHSSWGTVVPQAIVLIKKRVRINQMSNYAKSTVQQNNLERERLHTPVTLTTIQTPTQPHFSLNPDQSKIYPFYSSTLSTTFSLCLVSIVSVCTQQFTVRVEVKATATFVSTSRCV